MHAFERVAFEFLQKTFYLTFEACVKLIFFEQFFVSLCVLSFDVMWKLKKKGVNWARTYWTIKMHKLFYSLSGNLYLIKIRTSRVH